MKVYVAGAGAEIERVEAVIASLRAADVEVTEDWTVAVRQAMRVGRRDEDLPDEQAREIAFSDLDGVERCDVFWFLAPSKGGAGCWFELGFAFGQIDVPLIVASGERLGSIFLRLADERFERDADALDWILDRRR